MRTKAKKFIQNDLSEDVRQDSKGNRRKLMIYASSKDVRERSENKESFEIDESENSFWTHGANSTHFERYLIGKRIGQGAYAIVRAGIDTQTNSKVAVKIYDKLNLLDPQRK